MKIIQNISKMGLVAAVSLFSITGVYAQRNGGGDRGGSRPSMGHSGTSSPRPSMGQSGSAQSPRPSFNNTPRQGGGGFQNPRSSVNNVPRTHFTPSSPSQSPRPNPAPAQPPVVRNPLPAAPQGSTASRPPSGFGPGNSPRGNYNPRHNSVSSAYNNSSRFGYNNNRYGYNNGYRTGYNRGPIVVNRFYYGGAYHPRPVYYRPYNPVHFGIRINVLPFGYYPFYVGRSRYFYNDGLFYQPYDGYYQTIAPPLGAQVNALPAGATSVMINNEAYYEYAGTYYQRVYSGPGNFEVVGVNGYLKTDLPPQGDPNDIISDDSILGSSTAPLPLTVLPENYKTVTLNNITYYVSPSGEYYTKNIDESGKVSYQSAAVQSGN